MARTRYQDGYLKLIDGKWKARWREDEIVNGEVKRPLRNRIIGTSKDYATEKLARRALDAILAPINDRSYRPHAVAKFSEFAAKWEQTVLPNLKPSSQPPMKSHLRTHILPCLANVSMKDLDVEMVQGFLTSLNKKVGPKSVRNIKATLSIMWKSAKNWNYVNKGENPFDDLTLPEYEAPEQPYFEPSDVGRIVAAIDPHYRLAIWFDIQTGIRRGELCALNIGDIDFERRKVKVRRSAYQTQITNTKAKRPRVFDLSPNLTQALRQAAGTRKRDEPMFLTKRGKRLHPDNFGKRVIQPLMESLGLSGGLHGFRHGNATAQDQLGIPFKARQERLGHMREDMTLKYTHVIEGKSIGEMIDDYFDLSEINDQVVQ